MFHMIESNPGANRRSAWMTEELKLENSCDFVVSKKKKTKLLSQSQSLSLLLFGPRVVKTIVGLTVNG